MRQAFTLFFILLSIFTNAQDEEDIINYRVDENGHIFYSTHYVSGGCRTMGLEWRTDYVDSIERVSTIRKFGELIWKVLYDADGELAFNLHLDEKKNIVTATYGCDTVHFKKRGDTIEFLLADNIPDAIDELKKIDTEKVGRMLRLCYNESSFSFTISNYSDIANVLSTIDHKLNCDSIISMQKILKRFTVERKAEVRYFLGPYGGDVESEIIIPLHQKTFALDDKENKTRFVFDYSGNLFVKENYRFPNIPDMKFYNSKGAVRIRYWYSLITYYGGESYFYKYEKSLLKVENNSERPVWELNLITGEIRYGEGRWNKLKDPKKFYEEEFVRYIPVF